jgi:hypothetical protein
LPLAAPSTPPGAQRRLDVVTSLRVSPDDAFVVTGDTGGHIRTWDVSAGLDGSGAAAALRGGFAQRAHWRAHAGGVAGLDFVQGGPCPLLVSAGRDAAAAVWTLDGGLVGVLGEDEWELSDPSTWADAEAAARPPPLEPDQGAFAGGGGAAAGEGGAEEAWGGGGGGGGGDEGDDYFRAPAWAAAWGAGGGAAPTDSRGSGGGGSAAGGAPLGRATAEYFSDGVALAAAAAAAGRHDFGGVPLAQLMLQVCCVCGGGHLAAAHTVPGGPPLFGITKHTGQAIC